MKISIKTIAGNTHPLDVDETMQLGDLKKKIEDDLGYDGVNMKLVFKGKVLAEDGITLSQAGLVDNEFLVLVAKKKVKKSEPEAPPAPASEAATPAPPPATEATPQKPKEPEPAEAAQPSEPATATPESAVAPSAAEEEMKEDKPAEPAPAAAAAAPHVAADTPADIGAAASVFVTGTQLENVIKEIMEMGFPRDQVVRAMRAAYNNPDRAVDYLMSGIPENIEVDHPVQHPPAAPAGGAAAGGQGAGAGAGAGAAGAAGAAAGLAGLTPEALANNPQLMAMLQQMLQGQQQQQQQLSPLAQALQAIPQFEQLRQVIASNPQMMQAIIQQLRTSNPQLFQLINQNPQEFVQLLQNGIPSAGPAAAGGHGAGAPPGPGVIQVTPEEKAAIERLAALGFPERVAAEAYLVCGKNEELAANFLFENGAMDFDDAPGGDEGEGGN